MTRGIARTKRFGVIVLAIAVAAVLAWAVHDRATVLSMLGVRSAPSIVMVSLDSLRADHLGAYGYGHDTSPCIDRFARDAVVFANAFSHATWTLPSHMSLFTSLLPIHHGVERHDRHLQPTDRTLAEVLHQAGYATAAFTGGANLYKVFGFDAGFDVYVESYASPEGLTPGKGYRLREVLPEAFAWLDAHAAHPFFLFLHAFDTHEPFVAHPHLGEFDTGYDGPFLVLGQPHAFPDSELHRLHSKGRIGFNLNDFIGEAVNTGVVTVTPRDRRYIEALYDNEIRVADEAFCALLAKLDSLGLSGRTIVVLTADHGEELLERGAIKHGGLPYEEQIHVPLVMRVPGRPAARATKLARSIDVAPTLLALAELPQPATFEGHSLFPLEAPGAESVAIHGGNALGIRTIDRKAIFARPTLLYDLQNDPGELHNIARRERATVERLRAELTSTVARANTERSGALVTPRRLTTAERDRLRALGYAQ